MKSRSEVGLPNAEEFSVFSLVKAAKEGNLRSLEHRTNPHARHFLISESKKTGTDLIKALETMSPRSQELDGLLSNIKNHSFLRDGGQRANSPQEIFNKYVAEKLYQLALYQFQNNDSDLDTKIEESELGRITRARESIKKKDTIKNIGVAVAVAVAILALLVAKSTDCGVTHEESVNSSNESLNEENN